MVDPLSGQQASLNQQASLKLSPPVIVVVITLLALAFLKLPQDGEGLPSFENPPTVTTRSDSVTDELPVISPRGTKSVQTANPARITYFPGSGAEEATAAGFKEIQKGVFQSPAGLIYRSGSADGHRLDHVLKHSQNDPGKPVHGVFLGEGSEILTLIDEVWNLSQERGPPEVKISNERGRIVITANLNRDIGYVGGASGKRNGYPKCNQVRLVLEDRTVITAFPVQ